MKEMIQSRNITPQILLHQMVKNEKKKKEKTREYSRLKTWDGHVETQNQQSCLNLPWS